MQHPLDDDDRFLRLLETVAARASHPLVPELSLYQARVVEDVWERIEAAGAHRTAPPFWACLWPGGLAVARYLLDHPATVAGRRVLDVATGNGVIALAATLAGGRVTANDIDPLALRMTRIHASLHGLEIDCWLEDLLERSPEGLPFDLITVGDAFYEQPLASRLERWLHRAHHHGIAVLVGDPGRNFLPGGGLEPVAEYTVQTTLEVEGRATKAGRVFRLVQT